MGTITHKKTPKIYALHPNVQKYPNWEINYFKSVFDNIQFPSVGFCNKWCPEKFLNSLFLPQRTNKAFKCSMTCSQSKKRFVLTFSHRSSSCRGACQRHIRVITIYGTLVTAEHLQVPKVNKGHVFVQVWKSWTDSKFVKVIPIEELFIWYVVKLKG